VHVFRVVCVFAGCRLCCDIIGDDDLFLKKKGVVPKVLYLTVGDAGHNIN